MKKKSSSLFLFIGIGIVFILIVAAAAFGISKVTELSTKTYSYEQSPSAQSGYTRQTLTSGSTVYESDSTEYALQLSGSDTSRLVGTITEGGKIYAIPGQDPSEYVALWDSTSPVAVFRNSKHAAFDWRNADFYKMQFTPPRSTNTAIPFKTKESANPQLLTEVLESLKNETIVSPTQAGDGVKSYTLYLYSGELAGMSYCVGVYIDSTGRVYLAENTISQEWHQAGPLFSRWAKLP